ncbi:hypothetical protein A0H81_07933 [Grifola frondosa]|uniref:Uncharacterized protein n=1 Tax=Grifola frondosa TaxID=5627 RepID=A0A1C7M6Q3_GRIFR|nr:hypothetical protein A0H81_07933 [Grifola frondosa]
MTRYQALVGHLLLFIFEKPDQKVICICDLRQLSPQTSPDTSFNTRFSLRAGHRHTAGPTSRPRQADESKKLPQHILLSAFVLLDSALIPPGRLWQPDTILQNPLAVWRVHIMKRLYV